MSEQKKEKNMSKLLGFQVTEDLGERLTEQAWLQRMRLSELIRNYCEQGLKKDEGGRS